MIDPSSIVVTVVVVAAIVVVVVVVVAVMVVVVFVVGGDFQLEKHQSISTLMRTKLRSEEWEMRMVSDTRPIPPPHT